MLYKGKVLRRLWKTISVCVCVCSDVLSYVKAKNLQPVIQSVELPASAKPAAPLSPPPPVSAVKPAAVPVTDAGDFTDIEVTNMRSVIASRLTMSKVCLHTSTFYLLVQTFTCCTQQMVILGLKIINLWVSILCYCWCKCVSKIHKYVKTSQMSSQYCCHCTVGCCDIFTSNNHFAFAFTFAKWQSFYLTFTLSTLGRFAFT